MRSKRPIAAWRANVILTSIRTIKPRRINLKRFKRRTTFFLTKRNERYSINLAITMTTSIPIRRSVQGHQREPVTHRGSIFPVSIFRRVVQAADRDLATSSLIYSAAAAVEREREPRRNRRGRCPKRDAISRSHSLSVSKNPSTVLPPI